MFTHFNYSLQKQIVTLHPGEYHVSNEDLYMATVLGSCVAVALIDSSSGIGGLNHFMLPGTGDNGNLREKSAKYGIHAMELLINEMMKAGANRFSLKANVFGGGNVLEGKSNVGANNVRFALNYLEEERIQILSRDVEGIAARKIFFEPRTGKVLLKRLHQDLLKQVEKRENDYLQVIRRKNIYGDFILFDTD